MSISKIDLPGLGNLDANATDYLHAQSRVVEAPQGTVIFHPGKSCTEFLWLSKGCLRVQMVGLKGREIVLYRVTPGDSCIMTTSCILSGEAYNAEALVEEKILGISIPRFAFNNLLTISSGFREAVFESFGNRLGELLNYIEEISFGKLDDRLINFIKSNASGGQLLITHETLARELATHREVVSRLLKELERKGWIKLGHGKIVIDNFNALNSAV